MKYHIWYSVQNCVSRDKVKLNIWSIKYDQININFVAWSTVLNPESNIIFRAVDVAQFSYINYEHDKYTY